MASTIKGITIKLGADASELTTALHKADQSIRTTQNSLREINNSLKFNPNNVNLLKQKEVELNKAISETKTKLDTLKKALAEMDAKGVEKTDEAYMSLQRDILKAENQLKSYNDQLKQTTAQASSLGQLSSKLSEIGNKTTQLGQKMKSLSLACAGVVTAIGGMTYSTAVWADDLNTLSKVTGIATDKLQIYALSADLVDVEVGTIAKSVAKMKKSMQTASKGTGDAADAFKKLGVNVTDANGNLRDQDEVFQELLKALGQMENETERDALAMTIFGRSASQLNPLIEDMGITYSEVAKMLKENDLDILDQATIDKANEFNDAVDKVKLVLTQLKTILGAKMTEAFGEDMQKFSDAVTKIATKLSQMNPQVLKVITIIAGIVAVLAPVLIVIGSIANGISAVIAGIGMLMPVISALGTLITTIFTALSANPIGAAIALIVLAVVAMKTLYEKSEGFRNVCDKINNAVKNLGIKIKDFAVNAINKLKNAFATIKDIGANIVKGLWNGITNKFQWLVAKLKEFTTKVKDKLKSFFGIKSPSKWAKDVVGKNIVLGMAEGISGNANKVSVAMQSLVPATTPTLASVSNEMANAVGTGLAISNSGATGGTFQVTVNLGGAKVAEQIYKLNKQGQLALKG